MAKPTISNQRTFYIRTNKVVGDFEKEHLEFFKGRILDKNIWIDEISATNVIKQRDDINSVVKTNLDYYKVGNIMNFNWSKGETYSQTSGKKANTHIDIVYRGVSIKKNIRTYVNLTDKEEIELLKMFQPITIEEGWWKTNRDFTLKVVLGILSVVSIIYGIVQKSNLAESEDNLRTAEESLIEHQKLLGNTQDNIYELKNENEELRQRVEKLSQPKSSYKNNSSEKNKSN